jgi:hypothetical protein
MRKTEGAGSKLNTEPVLLCEGYLVPVVGCLDSPDHLIRSRQHIRRNCEADLLGGFEVYH